MDDLGEVISLLWLSFFSCEGCGNQTIAQALKPLVYTQSLWASVNIFGNAGVDSGFQIHPGLAPGLGRVTSTHGASVPSIK